MTTPDSHGIPFTLVCLDCDAGMHIENYQQALDEGWTYIDFAPDLPQANWCGLCPECREAWEQSAAPAKSQK